MTQPVSMFCRVGQHERCGLLAWDEGAGVSVACECECAHPVFVRQIDAYRAACGTHGWAGPIRTTKDAAMLDADGHRAEHPEEEEPDD